MALKLFSRKKSGPSQTKTNRTNSTDDDEPSPKKTSYEPAQQQTFDSDPLKRLLQQGRHNVILRNEAQWKAHQNGSAIMAEAQREMERRMALVPAGSVSIAQTLDTQPGAPEADVEVQPFLLDVHAISNARYQEFIDAGGYDDLDYWPEEIWPHLIELKDQTGEPGPRFWQHSRHNKKISDHPVVGISWYEAQAFALWIGQRLPTDAEWQMSTSWHINSSADIMRRFPWGDAMDARKCNIWSARLSTTAPVNSFPKGAAPNQVLQLIGNCWEWMDTEYVVTDEQGRPIVGEMPMHVVRGGAFDTYFETQATSQFRTGQIALARTHNTGFRCAMDLSEAGWINGS